MSHTKFDAADPQTWTAEAFGEDDPPVAEGQPAAASKPAAPSEDPIAGLTKRWRREYETAARRHQKALLADHEGGGASVKVVIGAAAKDFALADSLWRSAAQLAARAEVLVDNPRHVLALARAMREVMACRSAATARAEQLVLAAGTIRAQRRLANHEGKPSLRRVA